MAFRLVSKKNFHEESNQAYVVVISIQWILIHYSGLNYIVLLLFFTLVELSFLSMCVTSAWKKYLM